MRGGCVQTKAAPVGKGYDARLGEKVARHDAKHIRGAGKIERLALLRHAKAEEAGPGVHHAKHNGSLCKRPIGVDLAHHGKRVGKWCKTPRRAIEARYQVIGIGEGGRDKAHGRDRVRQHDSRQPRQNPVARQEDMSGPAPYLGARCLHPGHSGKGVAGIDRDWRAKPGDLVLGGHGAIQGRACLGGPAVLPDDGGMEDVQRSVGKDMRIHL